VTQVRSLRAHALAHSLFPPTTLRAALDRLGFVQADPIRAPARAQDLILRPRVAGYRAGDLEARYPELDLEEDLLYAYGFLTRPAWRLLHPRALPAPTKLEQRILAHVRAGGPTHPRTLEEHFGGARVVNAWGGSSKQTTDALDRLHRRGLLRIARRERGLRVFEAHADGADGAAADVAPEHRLAPLVLLVAHVIAPIAEPTLHTIAAYLARYLPRPRRRGAANAHRGVIRALLASGALERGEADERAYVWPAGTRVDAEPARRVTFLAPFDPVVWDRRRFEHLWGWAYRFVAYTPVAKRVRGYYALPLLWGDAVIGWANASVDAHGALDVQTGYVSGAAPRARDFRRELDAEVARLETFLAPRD
jgi:uncharacterized protein YcaQ